MTVVNAVPQLHHPGGTFRAIHAIRAIRAIPVFEVGVLSLSLSHTRPRPRLTQLRAQPPIQ